MSLGKAQEEFIRLARVARVATTRADGEPHAVPICPVLEDGKLSFATEADSAKVRNIRACPGWPSCSTSTRRCGAPSGPSWSTAGPGS